MSIVITRLFDTYEQASQTVAELEAGGVPHDEISLIGTNADTQHGTGTAVDHVEDPGSGAGAGATLGTVLGGGAGLLAGLGMLAIPGIGPVVAAGWLVATAVGAGVGAGAGGLLGSLVGAGVDESEANVYSEGVRRGGTLVTVRADESDRVSIERVMAKHQGVDAATRGSEYRDAGWEKFDETAPSYVAGGAPALGVSPTVGGLPIDPLGAVPADPVGGVRPNPETRERTTTLL